MAEGAMRVIPVLFFLFFSLYGAISCLGQDFCASLDPPNGTIVNVDVAGLAGLQGMVAAAAPGTTFLFADGTYNLNGVYLLVTADGVSLRGASGNREAVILDGNYVSDEIVQVTASNVTIADMTLKRAVYHPIHVAATNGSDVTGTLIHNVHIVDPGQQGIKINPDAARTHFTDDGEISCSRIELTGAGRSQVLSINGDDCYTGGIDAHWSKGWQIRDNDLEGFWCSVGLPDPAIHFWTGSRDTTVVRNKLLDNARGIGFGLLYSGSGRTYVDDPCPESSGYVDHYGGVIRNNFVVQQDPAMYDSEYGFDSGIALAQACGTRVIHNSVAASLSPFNSIEYRFTNTNVDILNNLTTHAIMQRDGASASLAGNITGVSPSVFADPVAGDLHLRPESTTIMDGGVSLGPDEQRDIDGQPRSVPPDVGADEYVFCGSGLRELIQILQVLSGTDPDYLSCPALMRDRDGDLRLSMADAIILLGELASP